MKFLIGLIAFIVCTGHPAVGQNFTEILGRPTNSAITMSILFDYRAEVYWEYGTSAGNYNLNTDTHTTVNDTALEVDLIGLTPDTKYFYRSVIIRKR